MNNLLTNELVLEPSTNTHKMFSSESIKSKDLGDGVMMIELNSNQSYVKHGEHGTLACQSTNIIKYVQKEYNPVTKAMQNSFD